MNKHTTGISYQSLQKRNQFYQLKGEIDFEANTTQLGEMQLNFFEREYHKPKLETVDIDITLSDQYGSDPLIFFLVNKSYDTSCTHIDYAEISNNENLKNRFANLSSVYEDDFRSIYFDNLTNKAYFIMRGTYLEPKNFGKALNEGG